MYALKFELDKSLFLPEKLLRLFFFNVSRYSLQSHVLSVNQSGPIFTKNSLLQVYCFQFKYDRSHEHEFPLRTS